MSPQNNVGRADAGMGAAEMALRGFDDYEVTLGDEMRGQRASLGVSLADVERDLRIKANTILAIENADLNSFPNQSVVAGYVRSYARYLDMDPEQSYRRFCDESGFRSPAARIAVAAPGAPGAPRVAINSRVGSNLTESRFAPSAAPQQIGSSYSLGAMVSAVALVALAGGLSYGGFYLLQDIQKVSVATVAESEEIVVEADEAAPPVIQTASVKRPDASAYEDGGVLALAAASELPPSLPTRDGPIADLDPRRAGLFSPVGQLDAADPRATRQPAPVVAESTDWNGDVMVASLSPDMMAGAPTDAELLTMSAGATAEEVLPTAESSFIYATGEAWIRVKDAAGTVLFEGILGEGERFELPANLDAPLLRAGNAGDVFVVIGSQAFGPVGAAGRVVKNVSLTAQDVRSSLPMVDDVVPAMTDVNPMQRA